MSKIHYVWWGNPATDELRKNATETPNKMVAAVHGKHEVHYWIGGGAGFSAPLDPRIIQHKINPATLLNGTSLVSLGSTRLKAVLDKLSEFRAFAACKDLVSFAVMLREGGYFFDTTTVIGEGYHQLKQQDDGKWVPRDPSRPTNIARLLAGHPDVRAPYNPEGVKNLYPNDESVDFVMSFGVGTIAKAGSVVVPNFDVWALYSPRAGHDAFKRAVETYVKRAENIGISTPDKKPLGKKTVTEIMSDPDKNSRNLIIAGLSTTSLLDAFYSYGKAHGHTMTDLGWAFAKINKDLLGTPAQPATPANPNGVPEVRSPKLKLNPLGVLLGKKKMNTVKIYGGLETAALTLPMIGIQKRFAGSWR